MTWDTNSSLPAVLSDGTNDYIDGPTGQPVEQISTTATQPSVPTFMTFTPGDSSWLLTNAAGSETGFYNYDAFGTLSFSSGTQAPFGYAGQYQGTAANGSSLENMRARWYDNQTGEFATRDPAFSLTDQSYEYAGNDPVNEADPSGESTIGCILGGIIGCGLTGGFGGGVLPTLILSVSWAPYSKNPCDANGWTLTVNPSGFGRATYILLGLASNLLVKDAWQQTLHLARKAAPSRPPGAVADSGSMHNQFVCHWLLVREIPFRAFHLQTWLSDPGTAGEIDSRCNPAPMDGWSPGG